jgi:hypothetical protein
MWRLKRWVSRRLGRKLSYNPSKMCRRATAEQLGPKTRNRVSPRIAPHRIASQHRIASHRIAPPLALVGSRLISGVCHPRVTPGPTPPPYQVSAIFLGNKAFAGYTPLIAWLVYDLFGISFGAWLARDPCAARPAHTLLALPLVFSAQSRQVTPSVLSAH